MSKLILITGFRGSGKSHASRSIAAAAKAVWINGDYLFATSLRLVRPELPYAKRNDWHEWPGGKRTAAFAVGVLESTIHRAVFHLDSEGRESPANLKEFRGHVLPDGAIFANDWFRKATQEALSRLGHAFDGVHYLYSNPPDSVIFQRIHARGRDDEIGVFPDIATVTRHNDGFRTCFGASKPLWTEMTAPEALNAEFEALLGGES